MRLKVYDKSNYEVMKMLTWEETNTITQIMNQILSLTVQHRTELPSEIANVTIMQTYQQYWNQLWMKNIDINGENCKLEKKTYYFSNQGSIIINNWLWYSPASCINTLRDWVLPPIHIQIECIKPFPNFVESFHKFLKLSFRTKIRLLAYDLNKVKHVKIKKV